MIFIYLLIIAGSFAVGQAVRCRVEKMRASAEEGTDRAGNSPTAAQEKGCAKTEKRAGSGTRAKFILRRYSRNTGAVMNLGEKHAKLVTGFAVAVFVLVVIWFCIVLPKKGAKLLRSGVALMLGGAAGNIYERIAKGYVTDYFSFSFLKKVIFNINDMFIIAGSLLSLAGMWTQS